MTTFNLTERWQEKTDTKKQLLKSNQLPKMYHVKTDENIVSYS